MEDRKHKHHHEEEEHKHHHHHHHPEHPECPPKGNPDCEGHTAGEKVLTESGLKAIIQRLTGRLMLAVGVVKARGDKPLKLWKEVDGDGMVIKGLMSAVSEDTDGYLKKEDYQKFLQALTDIETIFQRLANIDATLEGLANAITEIRAELAEIEAHLTKLDEEIVNINLRIDELTTLVNNLDARVTALYAEIEKIKETLGECINKIEASGDDCLTLSASKSGQTATVAGSVKSATTTQRGAMTATDKSHLDELWQKYQNGDFGCDCTHYTYGDISVSLSYSTASATATSLSPSMSYSQTVTDSSGKTTTLTSGATVVYSLSNAASGVTINSSTGVLSFSANTSTSQKTLGTVTVSVSMNEKTTTRSVTVYQAAAEDTGVTYEYGDVEVSLSYPTASANAGTVNPTYSYSQVRTGSDGSSTTITSGGTLEFISSTMRDDVEVDSSTGVVTFGDNPNAEQVAIAGVSLFVTLNGVRGQSDLATVYQAAADGTGDEPEPESGDNYVFDMSLITSSNTSTGVEIGWQNGSSAVDNAFNLNGNIYSSGTSYGNYYANNSSTSHVYNITADKAVGNAYNLFVNPCINYANITDVGISSNMPAVNLAGAFNNCIYLNNITGNGVNVTNLANTFQSCHMRLNNVDALSNWNVAKVTNMSRTFDSCERLANIDGIANWNVANVTNMTNAFYDCRNVTSVSALANWNVGRVTSMANTFRSCTALSSLEPLANWNVGRVTQIANIFYACANLSSFDGLANWNTRNLTYMRSAFGGCSNVVNLDAFANWNVANVTDTCGTFSYCSNVTSLDGLANWRVAKVTNMSSMFFNCSNITSLSALANWNVANVTGMESMFAGCENLTDITAINNWTGASANCSSMFAECNRIRGNVAIQFNITCASGMFGALEAPLNVYASTSTNAYNQIYRALGNSTTNSTWNVTLYEL